MPDALQSIDSIGNPPERTYEHVAVLMGGWSAEREISLLSGAAIAKALVEEGYRVTTVDITRDFAGELAILKPDVCFNALHGNFGEDGCVQGVLECLGLPYTHSGVLSSALAMHKERAKEVIAQEGVPVAPSKLVPRAIAAREHVLAPPYVVKPNSEGSSVGIFIVGPEVDLPPRSIAEAGGADDILMVEQFIPGRELTCAVIGDFVTDVTEILPLKGLAFYDYEAKYSDGGSEHRVPAELLPDVYQKVRKYTLAAHMALGCRGISRADFRFDDTDGGSGALVCLEVNTQPGMTDVSLVPELAEYAGWSFGQLARWIVEDASCAR